jgi:peptidoglycan/xylan/chitin deacetylase (PgdA/CDA1 family)
VWRSSGIVTQRIALTFDTEHPDRPYVAGGERRLLDLLANAGVRATFFIQGRWAEAYPEVAREIADAGHVIGNHSYYHVRMPLLSPDGFAADVRASERAIRAHAGVDPQPWFRFPFGAGANDPEQRAQLEQAGYRHVGWDVDPRDWDVGSTEEGIASALALGLAEAPGDAIVLLHAWPTPTPAALERLLPRMRDAGATFVTIDELGGEVRATVPA